MTELKLQAFDADDLKVLSAHCQDAIVRIDEMTFQSAEKRFALVCNRFDWAAVHRRSRWPGRKTFERRRAGLRFERVQSVKVQGFDPKFAELAAQPALTLLAITWHQTAPGDPAGHIVLQFGGGEALRLDVDMIEVELRDLGAVWSTERKPDHGNPSPAADRGVKRDADTT